MFNIHHLFYIQTFEYQYNNLMYLLFISPKMNQRAKRFYRFTKQGREE